MSEDKLHPTVREFKSFINKHPKLIEEVRRNGRHWQEYYEKWALLGEEDPLWEQYKEDGHTQAKKGPTKEKKPEIFGQIMKLTENMDIDKIQNHVQQLSTTISTVQEMLGQFKESKGGALPTPTNQPKPFNWFRD